jgi:uncharacterized protein
MSGQIGKEELESGEDENDGDNMFGITLILISTIIQAYVFWRMASMPMIKHCLSGRQLAGMGIGLWIVLCLSRFYSHDHTGKLAYILELIGMHWLGILFLLFFTLIATDILTGFGFLFSSAVLKIREAALIAGIILSLIALVQGTRLPVVEKYEVTIPGLPKNLDGKVIISVSDLHIGDLRGGNWLKECVEKIQLHEPDLVFLLGDVFEGHGLPDQAIMTVLSQLSAPFGVYAVLGNHEFNSNETEITRLMETNGIQVLRNRWILLQPGLVLAGIDDLRSFSRRVDIKTDLLSKALANRPEGATIFLSHRPDQVEKAAGFGVDLMLSGHTHGGQIWPFDYITQRFFPLLEGEYQINGMTVIVCRGAGTWGPNMRLFQPGEISHITLRSRS